MTDIINYSQCPVCYSDNITIKLKVSDHTVSREVFEIWYCSDCTLQFTQNIPGQRSIGRFYQSEQYISHTDTNQGIINRLYRFVRRFTLQKKKNIIRSNTSLSKGNLLDVGAGTGAFASYMEQSGWVTTGIEPDEDTRKRAADLHGIQLAESSTLFEMAENRFDVITLWHVLEHIHALHEYLDQFKKILKPEGSLFIAVPNYTSYDAAVYGELWAAYDVPRHLYHFSPDAMQKLLLQHGFRIKKIMPMWFDSFYVSMLSEKYGSGRLNLLKGFWHGAISNIKTLFNKEKASSVIYIIVKS